MTASLAALAADLTQRAEIGAEDVLALRRLVWHDGGVNTEEADALMALNTACPVRAPEWIDYFVEVMCDYAVHQQLPAGYVDDVKAQWLMKWIDHDGKVDTLAELELLVKVLETAQVHLGNRGEQGKDFFGRDLSNWFSAPVACRTQPCLMALGNPNQGCNGFLFLAVLREVAQVVERTN